MASCSNGNAGVSVIIPCYCCADTIGRAVQSVHLQTLRPSELILIDDCSCDDTLTELHRLQNLYSQGWIQIITLRENQGPGAARNVGWEASTQPYIAFLDADNSWHSDKIRIQYDWMTKHPAAVMSGHIQAKSSGSLVLNQTCNISPIPYRKITLQHLLFKNYFPLSSVMLKRDIVIRFEKDRRYCEDKMLWLQICAKYKACYRIDIVLSYQYKEPFSGGLSGELWNMQKSALNVYSTIHKDGIIGIHSYIFFATLSNLRYIRRLLIVGFRRLKQYRYTRKYF